MKLENFTEQSKLCLKGAENLARSKKNQMLCPEHLLKQILSEHSGIVLEMIKFNSANLGKIEELTEKIINLNSFC